MAVAQRRHLEAVITMVRTAIELKELHERLDALSSRLDDEQREHLVFVLETLTRRWDDPQAAYVTKRWLKINVE